MIPEKELFEKAEKIYHQHSESRYPKAIAAFRELLEYYPNNIKGWSMLATMYDCNKNFENGFDAASKCIELEPENYRHYDHRITLISNFIHDNSEKDHIFINNEDGTISNFEKYSLKTLNEMIIQDCSSIINLVEKDHYNLTDYYERRARVRVELGLFEEAIEDYLFSNEIHRRSDETGIINFIPDNLMLIAKIYKKLNDSENAIKYIDLAYSEESDEIYKKHKADLLNFFGNRRESEILYEEFIESVIGKFNDTLDAAYIFQAVDVMNELKQWDRALSLIDNLSPKARTYKSLPQRFEEAKSSIERLKLESINDTDKRVKKKWWKLGN